MSELLERVAAATKSVGVLKADKKNTHGGYEYLSEVAVKVAAQKVIAEHNIAPQSITFDVLSDVMVDMKNGGQANQIKVRCTLSWEDGKSQVQGLGCGQDYNDKALMKAQTAAIREAWKARLTLPSDADPEADTSTDNDVPATRGRAASGNSSRPAAKIEKPWDYVLPGTKNKGTRLGDLTDAQLDWYADEYRNEEARAHAQAERDHRRGISVFPICLTAVDPESPRMDRPPAPDDSDIPF